MSAIRSRTLVWLGAALVILVGVAASTVATLLEGREHPMCPDDAFGCVETGGAEGAIRIAALVPLTGSRTADGREAVRGIRVALDRRDASLFGHPVRLVQRDDGCAADRIALVARKLAIDYPESPPITAVIGAACPHITEPAAQILSDSGIPLVSWSTARVAFIDPPPERSFYVPIDPTALPDDGFEAEYRERYGSGPRSPWAHAAFGAAELILDAIERVGIEAPRGEVLIPRVRLREALQAT